MEIIRGLEWRYATKKFDPKKKIPAAVLAELKKAVQLSASSYGLQPYRVLQIDDDQIRAQLLSASFEQSQVVDASHLFVFCSQKAVNSQDVAAYFDLKAHMNGLDPNIFKNAVTVVSEEVAKKSEVEMEIWTAKQTYLAVGTLLAAAGEAAVDACPMEGFEPDQYDKILGLSAKGLTANVVIALGYRLADDQTAQTRKTRKPLERLFEHY